MAHPDQWGQRFLSRARLAVQASITSYRSAIEARLPQSVRHQTGFSVGASGHQVQVNVDALPVKRYVRLAFLGHAFRGVSEFVAPLLDGTDNF
jgi:hypothetical protein